MGLNGAGGAARATEKVFAALDGFRIEVPSWGFANTGTRFGKFSQAAAATTLEEKFSDASEVNKLTGASPTVALHVLWDLPNGKGDVPEIKRLEGKFGVRIEDLVLITGSGCEILTSSPKELIVL